MENSISSVEFRMLFKSLVQELLDDLSHPIGFLQIGAIGVTYLLAWFFARKINHYLEKDIEKGDCEFSLRRYSLQEAGCHYR